MTSRNYCFTSFNLDVWNQPNIAHLIETSNHKVRYLIFQIESCPTTSRHHAQGYAEFTSPVRQNAVKIMFSDNSIHLESRLGTRDQARHYCMCSGPPCTCLHASNKIRISGPFEFGEWTTGQGQRTDLIQLQSAINSGAPIQQVAQQHFGSFLRYERSIRTYQNLVIPPRNFKTELHIVWGHAGSGKAHSCFSKFPPESFFRLSPSGSYNLSFDGYDPSIHENILIKDFYGWIPYPTLLQLCDSYPLQVKILYGSAQFTAKRIFITSHDSPLYWYLPPTLSSTPSPNSTRPFHSVDIMSLLNSITSLQYRSAHWSNPSVFDRTQDLRSFLDSFYFKPPSILASPSSLPQDPYAPFPDFLKVN